MRLLLLSVLVGSLAAGAGAGENKRQIDETTLNNLAAEFAVAWNHHDAKALTAFFTLDGTLINPYGREAKGAAEIEKLFTDEHGGLMKESVMKAAARPAQWLRPDLVITTWDSTIRGIKTPDGKVLPPSTAIVTSVMTKVKQGKDEKWLCAAARPMVPLPTPGGSPAPAAK